jgi:hypothetical protein
VAAASGSDRAAAAALEKQLVAPLQAQIAALRSAQVKGGNMTALLPEVQAALKGVSDAAAKQAASGNASVAAALDGLTGGVESTRAHLEWCALLAAWQAPKHASCTPIACHHRAGELSGLADVAGAAVQSVGGVPRLSVDEATASLLVGISM